MMTQTTPATLELTGASGRKYAFLVYPWGTSFKPLGGVYAVTRAVSNQAGGETHTIVYVGQTGDLSERFDNHHKANCFARHSSNRICVHVEGNEETRLAIEADLIAAYNPPCNG
jgi:GIY-YIG catalytic domain